MRTLIQREEAGKRRRWRWRWRREVEPGTRRALDRNGAALSSLEALKGMAGLESALDERAQVWRLGRESKIYRALLRLIHCWFILERTPSLFATSSHSCGEGAPQDRSVNIYLLVRPLRAHRRRTEVRTGGGWYGRRSARQILLDQ